MGLQCPPMPYFATFCALAKSFISAGKSGEPGKSQHIAPFNGSQMVVEIQGSYYRFQPPS